MGAASSGEYRIKGVPDEGDIGYATNQAARICARLAGRKRVAYRHRDAIDDPRDAPVGRATCVRPNGSDYHAGRIQSASSPFGNIKEAVGPELKAAGIV
jgi:hypothetical protein